MFKRVSDKFDPTLLAQKYPNTVPIVLKKIPRSPLPDLSNARILMKNGNTVSDLYKVLRSQINLPPETALFFFIGSTIPSITATFGDLYRDYKNGDGILYITYTDENVYGNI